MPVFIGFIGLFRRSNHCLSARTSRSARLDRPARPRILALSLAPAAPLAGGHRDYPLFSVVIVPVTEQALRFGVFLVRIGELRALAALSLTLPIPTAEVEIVDTRLLP
jgi:hypothetical protein